MRDDTLLRVIAGIVRVTIDGARRTGSSTGDEMVIPAGASHRLASAGGVAAARHRPARGPSLSAERVDQAVPAEAQALHRPAEAAALHPRTAPGESVASSDQGGERRVQVRGGLAQQDAEVRRVQRERAAAVHGSQLLAATKSRSAWVSMRSR